MKMQAKAITIRVSTAEFHTLAAQAEGQKTSVTRYVTQIVKEGVQSKAEDDRLTALETRLMARMDAQDAAMAKIIALVSRLEAVDEPEGGVTQ